MGYTILLNLVTILKPLNLLDDFLIRLLQYETIKLLNYFIRFCVCIYVYRFCNTLCILLNAYDTLQDYDK